MTWLYWAVGIFFGISLLGYMSGGDENTSPGQAKVVVFCVAALLVGLVLLGVMMGGGHNATHPWD